MVSLLSINHQLELWELLRHWQHLLVAHFLAATEILVRLLLLLVERVLSEV